MRSKVLSFFKAKTLSELNVGRFGRVLSRHSSSQSPFSRTINIIKDDFQTAFTKGPRKDHLPTHCDVLIVGGGVMGSSIAFWLKHRALEGLSVAVVEKDPTVTSSLNTLENIQYQRCSSALSVGGLRQQFSLPENIELSLKSAEFLRNIKEYLTVEGEDPPDIQFHPCGYLFLASERGAHILEENHKIQRSLGAKVELLSAEQLKARYPWLNTEGIVAGSHGLENEGWFDPYSLVFAFKRKALSLGAHYIAAEVEAFQPDQQGPELIVEGESRPRDQYHHALLRLANGEEHLIEYSILVIAAGGYSGQVAELLGIGRGPGELAFPLPVEPRKRYVFNIHCPDGPGLAAPMVIDASGAYFRREGLTGHYLCGISPPDEEEPDHGNLDVDYSFFEEKLWPILANRVPAFETAKIKSAWAGYYDFNRFDENAFIGPHPAFMNVLLATGFSGHGIQQSPMVGKAIMELIVDSEYQTVNLERLHFDRVFKGERLYESNIV